MPTLGEEHVYIIGSGPVGLGLACAFRDAGIDVCGLSTRSAARAQELAPRMDFPVEVGIPGPSAGAASVMVLCVPDSTIPAVAKQVTAVALKPNCLVAHTSGCLTAQSMDLPPTVLQASMHPLLACASPTQARRDLRQALYALEGHPQAVARLEPLVTALGGQARPIAADHKARYHAAAVMSSNLMVALVSLATAEAEAAGLTDSEASLVALSLNALRNVESQGAEQALTGPVLRGDATTVEKNLQALGPEAREVYTQLSRQALKLAETRGLESAQVEILRLILSAPGREPGTR